MLEDIVYGEMRRENRMIEVTVEKGECVFQRMNLLI